VYPCPAQEKNLKFLRNPWESEDNIQIGLDLKSLSQSKRDEILLIIITPERRFVSVPAVPKPEGTVFKDVPAEIDDQEAALFILCIRAYLQKGKEFILISFPSERTVKPECHIPGESFGKHQVELGAIVRIAITVGMIPLVRTAHTQQSPMIYFHVNSDLLESIFLLLSPVYPLIGCVHKLILKSVPIVRECTHRPLDIDSQLMKRGILELQASVLIPGIKISALGIIQESVGIDERKAKTRRKGTTENG
jgi:hypothetical protein